MTASQGQQFGLKRSLFQLRSDGHHYSTIVSGYHSTCVLVIRSIYQKEDVKTISSIILRTSLKVDHRIICLLKFYGRQRNSEHHHVEYVVILGYLSHILRYPACKIQYCDPESYRGSLLIPFFSVFILAHPCLRALPLPISASSCSVAPAASIAIDNLRAHKCHSAQEPRISTRP